MLQSAQQNTNKELTIPFASETMAGVRKEISVVSIELPVRELHSDHLRAMITDFLAL